MLEFLENMANSISTDFYIAPIICLVAGFLSALMPCSLSQLPLLIAYLGGYNSEQKTDAAKYSISYILGNTIVFITLGVISALLGKTFGFLSKRIYIVFGILMVIMFLQLLGIINIIPQKARKPSTSKKGALGAFILGIIGGFFASPCATPVLIAILSFVIPTKNVFMGIVMLLFYSIGNGIVLYIIGCSLKLADKISSSNKFEKLGKVINVIISLLVLLLGLYMFYLGF